MIKESRMKRMILILLPLILVLAARPAARAADPVEDMSRAAKSYYDGKYVEAVDILRGVMTAVFQQAPLTVRHVTFVSEEPEGFGAYKERSDSAFDSIDPVQLYCEPIGYTARTREGMYLVSLSADFAVIGQDGKLLGGQKNFYKWEGKSRAFNTEFMMLFTFNLKGLPPGRYTLAVTLRDNHSHKTAKFEKPFSIKK